MIGLIGGRSGIGCISGCMNLAQSCSVCFSSPGRNQSVVGCVSFVEVSPAVLLDRLFRSLSVEGSGDMFTIRVGSTGPCFRWATCWIWQSVTELSACCWIGSQSPWRWIRRHVQQERRMDRTYLGLVDGQIYGVGRTSGLPSRIRGAAGCLYAAGCPLRKGKARLLLFLTIRHDHISRLQ